MHPIATDVLAVLSLPFILIALALFGSVGLALLEIVLVILGAIGVALLAFIGVLISLACWTPVAVWEHFFPRRKKRYASL